MVSIKSNVNYTTYGHELWKIHSLAEQTDVDGTTYVPLTTTGNVSWTSNTSSIVYDTSTSSDPNIVNKGTSGLLYWLNSLFLLDTGSGGYGDSLIDQTYLAAIVAAIRDSELNYAADGGVTDAYAISLEVAPTAYTTGMVINFTANTANAGACTLNANSLGAKSIKDINGADPTTGMIAANQIVKVVYDGTNFVIQSVCPLMNTADSTLTTPTIVTPTIRNWPGWQDANETWTYASSTSFTVSGDVTGKYQKGNKIKLTQTTVKYFYITNVSYSSPNTTITITGGTDYTLASASISANYYSNAENPYGFPFSFNFTPTLFGTTTAGTPTYASRSGKFSIQGGSIRASGSISISAVGGMSGDTKLGLPLVSSSISGGIIGAVLGMDVQGACSLHLSSGNSSAYVCRNGLLINASTVLTSSFNILSFNIEYYF